MDQELTRRWNARVKEEDYVLHLGDFNFKRSKRGYEYYADQLNGHIILIRGNHDEKNDTRSKLTACVVNHGGIDWYCQHRPTHMFKYNLCGHVHELFKVRRKGPFVVVNVGVDVWDFYPIDIQEILQAVEEERKQWEGKKGSE